MGVAWVDNYEMVIADIPGLIEGASEGIGLGDRFLKHIERCFALLHLVDATSDDVVTTYKSIRKELELYDEKLAQKPEVVALNKIDALDDKEVAKKQKELEKVIGKKVFAISAIAKKGVFDCLLEVNKYITRDRKRKEDEVIEEQVAVVEKTWSPL